MWHYAPLAFFVFYVAALLCAVVVVGFSFTVLFGVGL